MMNRPALNEMIEKTGSRYMLVTVVARRARQLIEDPDKLGDRKPVSVAVYELEHDLLRLDYPDEYTEHLNQ